jgi:hypothetical protein
MWLPVAMAAGSMLMNNQQRKDTQRHNKAQANAAAAQTQFSPWTGHGPGRADIQQSQSNLAAGVQGGMAGASMAQSYDQAQSQKNLADNQSQLYKQQSQSPWFTNAKLRNNNHMMADSQHGVMG